MTLQTAPTWPRLLPLDELPAIPGHLVRWVQQISTALFAEECGKFDLTSVQYAAQVVIAAAPGPDARRLSAQIAADRSTLGDVLERLVGKGWLQRAAGKLDRRVKRLTLTAAGQALLEQVQPSVDLVQRRLLAPLDASDRAVLLSLLGQLRDGHDDFAAATADGKGTLS